MTTLDMYMVDDTDHTADKDGGVTRKNPTVRLAERRERYEELAAELARVGIIASGSLALRSHRCGKANCACMADPPRPHGPYWHLTTKVAGKTVNRRLTEAEATIYQEWIANDRLLRALIEELRVVAQDVIELTLAETRAASEV